MNLWELIKNGAGEGVEVLKDGALVAGKTSRILRKKVELTSVQGDVRKIFTRLGNLAYDLHSKSEGNFYGDDGVKNLITQIEGHKNRVREIETEIETIRGEERRRSSAKPAPTGEPHPPI